MRAAKTLATLTGAALLSAAAPPPTPSSGETVERVVMVMRHGVRPSTKFPATPVGTTREPWSAWSSEAGDLTPHGAAAVRLLGAYDRGLLVQQGLLPATGCAGIGTISAWASGASRAIKTGHAFLETLQPGCQVALDHPASEDEDETFHPADAGLAIDGEKALAAALRIAPAGGIDAEVARNADAFRVLERVVGCCPDKSCDTGTNKNVAPAPCTAAERRSRLVAEAGDKPDMKGALSFASTAGQTILLQYLEGMPMAQVGWGRASAADIRTMLRFHPIKFRYETRPPYVAQRLAAPLARRILDAVAGKSGKVTLLFGHDTNLAALGGFYDLHWTMADYPADDIAPGGAIGFEVVRAHDGQRYVRAFSQAQLMDQVRGLTPLTAAQAPDRRIIAIPGCGADRCTLEAFEQLTTDKLKPPSI
ncbi:histidine-type phosphatase [Sphingomonas sp. Mn802worker]|uniref:histidine-type phosphatase n=1 Tax=Sphingomonas sp. Mn802worker TaxID=629773 RepID=UPI00037EA9B6|nr:histidine-type phosphatase [Sphingomonas sp. Mn802worker]